MVSHENREVSTMVARAKELAEEPDNAIIRTTIRVPGDLWDAVNICAEAERVSANAIVTEALVDFVSAEEHRAEVNRFFEAGRERFDALLSKLS
jgi:hypothetical protein